MKKLKVSWTILNTWDRGYKDDAIKMLAGISMEPTPAMERGKKIHKIIADHKLNLLPEEISDQAIFEDIRPDDRSWVNYFRVSLNEWLDLSLVIDVLDVKNRIIVDWKASKRRSTQHKKTQIYLYALAMLCEGHKIDYGIFATVDQAKSDDGVFCREYSKFKISKDKLLDAYDFAETLGSEIYSELHDVDLEVIKKDQIKKGRKKIEDLIAEASKVQK